MHPLDKSRQEIIDENPFLSLKISDPSILDTVEARSLCKKCKKSRKYFCYICYLPVPFLEGKIPQVSLPIKIDIIKHKNEIDGKSTAAHAAILAPDDVRIMTYPNVPDYEFDGQVVLVYPGHRGKSVKDWFEDNPGILKTNDLPFTRAVFIDSTWNQSKRIFKDKRVSSLPTIILRNRITQFWRHQRNTPRWYLATIEAVHQLLVELDIEKNNYLKKSNEGQSSSEEKSEECTYDGKYDNLLYFFYYMYGKIHELYDHKSLLSYKRPLE